MRCFGIHHMAISQKILEMFIVEMSLKFTHLGLYSNPPGANESRLKMIYREYQPIFTMIKSYLIAVLLIGPWEIASIFRGELYLMKAYALLNGVYENILLNCGIMIYSCHVKLVWQKIFLTSSSPFCFRSWICSFINVELLLHYNHVYMKL